MATSEIHCSQPSTPPVPKCPCCNSFLRCSSKGSGLFIILRVRLVTTRKKQINYTYSMILKNTIRLQTNRLWGHVPVLSMLCWKSWHKLFGLGQRNFTKPFMIKSSFSCNPLQVSQQYLNVKTLVITSLVKRFESSLVIYLLRVIS